MLWPASLQMRGVGGGGAGGEQEHTIRLVLQQLHSPPSFLEQDKLLAFKPFMIRDLQT